MLGLMNDGSSWHKIALLSVLGAAQLIVLAVAFVQRDSTLFQEITLHLPVVMALLLGAIGAMAVHCVRRREFRSSFRLSHITLIILLVILAWGAALRTLQPLVHSIHYDEHVYLHEARMILETGTTALCASGTFNDGRLVCDSTEIQFSGHHKGYPMLLALLFLFTGPLENVAFYFGLLLALSTIVAVFYIGKELGGDTAGVIAAGLLTFLPAHIHWSISTGSDTPALFFLSAAVLLALIAVRTRDLATFFLALLVLSFAAFIRNEMLIALPFVLLLFPSAMRMRVSSASWLAVVASATLSLFIFFNLLSDLVTINSISGMVKDIYASKTFASIHHLFVNAEIILEYHRSVGDIILLVMFAGAAAAIGIRGIDKKKEIAVIAALAATLLVFYFSLASGAYGHTTSIATIRYSMPWAMLFISIAAVGWSTLFARLSHRHSILLAISLVAVLGTYTVVRYDTLVPKSQQEQTEEIATILAHAKKNPECRYIVSHPAFALFAGVNSTGFNMYAQEPQRYQDACVIFFKSLDCRINPVCDRILKADGWEQLPEPRLYRHATH